MLPKNIRITYQDAHAILPDGGVESVATIKNAELAEIVTRPLLIINTQEMNPKALRELLDSGFYRRMFADSKRLDTLLDGCVEINLMDRSTAFKIAVDGDSNWYTRYRAAETTERRTKVLEELYDSKIANIGIDRIISLDAGRLSGNRPIRPMLTEHYIPQALPVMESAARIIAAYRNWPLIGGFAGWVADKIYEVPHEVSFDKVKKRAVVDSLEWHFDRMPEFIREGIDKIGLNIQIRDKIPNNNGTSMYEAGYIELVYDDIFRKNDLVIEEVVHQLDNHLGLTKRQSWRNAVMQDVIPENHRIEEYYDSIEKASLFDGVIYSKEQIFAEVFADMFNMEYVHKWQPEVIQEIYPNVYPVYVEFREKLKQFGTKQKEAEAPPEQVNGKHAEKLLAASGAGMKRDDRGGRSTLPTEARKSWTGE